MGENKEYLTQKRYDELVSELEYLKINRRKEVAKNLEEAKSLGDLSENAEYHDARNEQAKLEDRINQVEYILKNAEIVSQHHSNAVEVGTCVTVQKAKEKDKHEYEIVGSEEADISQNKISHLSPLGQALLGKKKGEEFEFKTPKGSVKYKIVSIK